MTFDQWSSLMTQRLKRTYPNLSVLARNPGICYVNGIASLDMVELVSGEVMIIRHKDPMTVVEGILTSRHKGLTLERVRFTVSDEEFPQALDLIKMHLD